MRIKYTTIRNTSDAKRVGLELCKEHGGAWVYSVNFSQETTFARYNVPSKVPDFYIEQGGRVIFYKGKELQFSSKRIIRNQNQGIANR